MTLPDHLGIGVEATSPHRADRPAVAVGVLHRHHHGLAEHQGGKKARNTHGAGSGQKGH
jgi:hypothetical protein